LYIGQKTTPWIGNHSDSWCSTFPHPKEAILNDINNYVCYLTNSLSLQVFSFLVFNGIFKIEQAFNGKEHRFIKVAPYGVCKGTDHLEKIFQDIMDQGGEGIILRDPSSPIQAGRSKGFLKHKVCCFPLKTIFIIYFLHLSEISRCGSENSRACECSDVGMRAVRKDQTTALGNSSIVVIQNRPNAVRFVAPAGTTEFAKRWNPQPGDIVSFKHRGFMFGSNKPKLPTLYRLRNDITWDDVIHNWKEQIVTPTGISLSFTPLTILLTPIFLPPPSNLSSQLHQSNGHNTPQNQVIG